MDFINIPIPVTKMKLSKDKWLKTPVKYDNNLVVKDIIEEMCEKTYQWIDSKSDLDCISDYDTFKIQFINFLYDKYYQ